MQATANSGPPFKVHVKPTASLTLYKVMPTIPVAKPASLPC